MMQTSIYIFTPKLQDLCILKMPLIQRFHLHFQVTLLFSVVFCSLLLWQCIFQSCGLISHYCQHHQSVNLLFRCSDHFEVIHDPKTCGLYPFCALELWHWLLFSAVRIMLYNALLHIFRVLKKIYVIMFTVH